MYDFAHVWIPEKSLVRERYAAVLGHTPRVLSGLPQSWEPLLHVIQHASFVYSVAYSPDGGRLASGSDEIVRIWNTATGELEDELEGHTDKVWSVAFSHNGRFIVSGSRDKTVRIWNTATSETRYTLTGHRHKVTSVAISRDDKFVVSGSSDRTVRIWDTATGEVLHELEGHACPVESVAILPNCQHIASWSGGEVWIWTKDGVLEHRLECPKYTHDLVFSHDGRRIVCNTRTEWTTMGHHLSPLHTDNDPYLEHIWSMAYSPNDNEISCGMLNGTVMIWNTETNATHKLGGHSDWVWSVAFSPDGSRVASGSKDHTVRIWDPSVMGTFTEEVVLRRSSALSHDGRWIVIESFGHIQVWRVTETMTKTNNLTIENPVSLALSRDGSRVVIGCNNGSIQVWNHSTDAIECQMSGHSQSVSCVAFSYDESHVVSGSRDSTVRIWDCHTGNKVDLYQHLGWVTCVTFSRDGGCVAFGDDGGTVQIWNPTMGRIQTKPRDNNMPERQAYVCSVAFSHNSNHVISGQGDGVWAWNVTTNEATRLSERIQLPDGTRVHSLGKGDFHICDPIDQDTTNGRLPYLLSISPDRDWITGEQGEYICWIYPQYRTFSKAHIAESIVCLQSDTGIIVLDLKNTQHAKRVMPGV